MDIYTAEPAVGTTEQTLLMCGKKLIARFVDEDHPESAALAADLFNGVLDSPVPYQLTAEDFPP